MELAIEASTVVEDEMFVVEGSEAVEEESVDKLSLEAVALHPILRKKKALTPFLKKRRGCSSRR